MSMQDKYKVAIYYGDDLIESISILSDNYPLVYSMVSAYFDNDNHCTKCFICWRGVVLADFTDNSRLNNEQQITPSL